MASTRFCKKESDGENPRVRMTRIGPKTGVVVMMNLPFLMPSIEMLATSSGD